MTSTNNFHNGQRGAVLVVALIMLAVMTLLVITMLKTVVVDLKIGGASQQASVNLANADVALNSYFAQNPTFSLGCLVTGTCNVVSGPVLLGAPLDLEGSRAVVTATQLGCVSPPRGSGCQLGACVNIIFDARADVTGRFALVATTGRTVVHQGIQAPAPVGAPC